MAGYIGGKWNIHNQAWQETISWIKSLSFSSLPGHKFGPTLCSHRTSCSFLFLYKRNPFVLLLIIFSPDVLNPVPCSFQTLGPQRLHCTICMSSFALTILPNLSGWRIYLRTSLADNINYWCVFFRLESQFFLHVIAEINMLLLFSNWDL